MKSILVTGNITSSGFIAIFISYFFAEGGLGESVSLTPEFFLMVPIWAIGALLMWKFVSQRKIRKYFLF